MGCLMTRHQRLLVFGMLAVVVIIIGGTLAAAWVTWQKNQAPTDITTTYFFDPIQEKWIKITEYVRLLPNPDGSQRRGHHTVIIRLDEDNPVKTIWIEEALVIGGTEPLLEIDGQPDPLGSGTIRICNLIFQKVDAEDLEIDADVVRVTLENVVAKDNELDLDITVVNVITCGRGGASTLFLGVSRRGLIDKIQTLIDVEELDLLGIPERDMGMRIDRIRILGPDSGTGFIEHLIIRRTSVFGEIRVDNVKIQNLIIKDVTLDDFLSSGN